MLITIARRWPQLLCRLALLPVALLAVAQCAVAADFHHVQLNVADPAAAIAWYVKNLGGEASRNGSNHAVAYGKITIRFTKAEGDVAGSVGSVVDHLGFSFKDIDAKMRELADSGVEIVSGVQQEGPIKYAFIRDPWSTLVEVVQDPDLLGFHHIHLATTDPQATVAWYHDAFGGEATRFVGLIPGVRYDGMWVLVKRVKEPRAPTKGRSIDHVSWSSAIVKETVAKLKASGSNIEQSSTAADGANSTFVEGPGGVRIEIVDTAL